jgi:hypothetical protein
MLTGTAEVADLIRQFEDIVRDARSIVGPLSPEVFNRQPAAGGWSVGQCVEHLNITERAMLQSMRLAAAEARTRGKRATGPTRHGLLMRFFIKTMEPPVRRRLRTGAAFVPPRQLSKEEVVAEFVRLHDEVITLLREVDGYDLSPRVQSPFAKVLRYRLGSALALMAAHDRRHLWQAREAGRMSG